MSRMLRTASAEMAATLGFISFAADIENVVGNNATLSGVGSQRYLPAVVTLMCAGLLALL